MLSAPCRLRDAQLTGSGGKLRFDDILFRLMNEIGHLSRCDVVVAKLTVSRSLGQVRVEPSHRLAEQHSNAHMHPYFGEYQIGDVNARSCVVIGTFGSVILILKYAAS